jgi:type III secretion protein W
MQDIKEAKIARQAQQQDSLSGIDTDLRDNINPFAKKRTGRKESMKSRARTITKSQLAKEKGQRMLPVERLKNAADQYQRRNPEMKPRVLVHLRQMIKPDDSVEEILRKVQEFYDDVSLADEALEYLLETTEGELHQKVQEAKDQFNAEFEREIAAGRNIGEVARDASAEGLGTPTSLRDLYRDITANPREAAKLFVELSDKFSYQKLKPAIDFLLHSVGTDLKSTGPSIAKGLLHNLILEVRSLQAILGVYSFFKGRMGLVGSLFSKNGIPMPKELTFEQLAKQFMAICGDRYPSPDKILQSAKKLGIEKWIMAKIIAFSQLRDAIREVAMSQVYRSVQHRDEVYAAIIAALEALEEELDELLDVEEEDDDDFGEEEDDF